MKYSKSIREADLDWATICLKKLRGDIALTLKTETLDLNVSRKSMATEQIGLYVCGVWLMD